MLWESGRLGDACHDGKRNCSNGAKHIRPGVLEIDLERILTRDDVSLDPSDVAVFSLLRNPAGIDEARPGKSIVSFVLGSSILAPENWVDEYTPC